MSPAGSEPDRSLSPTGSRIRPVNGVPMQPFPAPASVPNTSAVPARPKRADDPPDDLNPQSSAPRMESPLFQRGGDRAVSPDPSRAKSPGNGSSTPSRAMSPTQQQQYPPGVTNGHPPNMASVAMGGRNGLSARSPSPVVDRTQPPSDAFYSLGTRSPTVTNGFSPGSRPGSSGRPGSGGSVIVDMLKQKEADLETAKRRESWMRAALSKATKAGFIWDTNASLAEGDDENLTRVDGTESGDDVRKLGDLVLALKRDRARIQVCDSSRRMTAEMLTIDIEPRRGASACDFGTLRGGRPRSKRCTPGGRILSCQTRRLRVWFSLGDDSFRPRALDST